MECVRGLGVRCQDALVWLEGFGAFLASSFLGILLASVCSLADPLQGMGGWQTGDALVLFGASSPQGSWLPQKVLGAFKGVFTPSKRVKTFTAPLQLSIPLSVLRTPCIPGQEAHPKLSFHFPPLKALMFAAGQQGLLRVPHPAAVQALSLLAADPPLLTGILFPWPLCLRNGLKSPADWPQPV